MANHALRSGSRETSADVELLLALLVSRLGGRQVATPDELADARRLQLDIQRAGDALVLAVASLRCDPQSSDRPLFHLEGEA
jgi:hypothetical protein